MENKTTPLSEKECMMRDLPDVMQPNKKEDTFTQGYGCFSPDIKQALKAFKEECYIRLRDDDWEDLGFNELLKKHFGSLADE